jgi:hypothetical protein
MNPRSLHPYKKLLTAAVALAALLLALASSAKPEATQTAAERRGLNFPHQLHETQGLGCDACHTNAAASATGADDLLPGHPQCQDCHDVTDAKNCAMCHRGEPGAGPRVSAYSPKFSHQRHLDKGKLGCTVCHANLDQPLVAGSPGHLPVMVECMACHNTKSVKNDCATCHLPKDDLVPADHKLNWVYNHGAGATADQDACHVCHSTDDCQRCHNGDAIFSPHPRNYVSRHGQDARLSDLSCTTCHDRQDDCNACHAQNNVVPVDHFQPGWVNRTDGGKHGEQASFDLESCIACHDDPNQQPVCARCHHK